MSEAQASELADTDRASSDQPAVTVRKALITYIATLWLLMIVAVGIIGVHRLVLHQRDAHSLIFCCSGSRFSDFTDLSDRVAHFPEPDMLSRTDFVTPYPYPVPSIYAFLFFIRLFPRPLAAYLVFAFLSFFLATCWLSLRVRRTSPGYLPQVAVWSTLLLAYPLAFLLDRGNIEAIIWVLVLLGIVAYSRNRMVTSATLWSLAASMKIFPGLLFVMFLAKRKYWVVAFAIAATAAITILALAGVGPSIHQAVLNSSSSVPWIRNNYILSDHQVFDHSLFSATKEMIYLYSTKFRVNESQAILYALRIYSIVIPLGAALLWWFRLRRMPLLNQFMAYLTMCILLPYVSEEYTLIYVYLIWGAFLLFLLADVATGKVAVARSAIYIILLSCAFLFTPLVYSDRNNYRGTSGPAKALILLVLLLTVVRVPMPSSLFSDLSPAGDPQTTKETA